MTMAKDKTEIDVELAKIKAGIEVSKYRWGTVRIALVGGYLTAMVGIIAWAIVRVMDRPAWSTVILALLGTGGGTSWLAWRVAVRLKRKAESIDAEIVVRAEDQD
jgi:hypothetical protein